ncbi:MAG: hypothetical protein MPK62_06530, partial [Alphaproteobacteria bacterium]|nr:hypothetical protein [Alphaproteobacteria bacterium]
VHLTLNEALFNIDPTDIDVWSWFNGASSSLKLPHYYLFDSNRNEQLTGPSAESEVFEFADDAMDSLTMTANILAQIDFGTSGPLTFDDDFGPDMPIRPLNPTPRDNQLNMAANNPLGLPSTGNGLREVGTQSPVITVKETGPNTGVFTNTDGNSRSDLITGLESIGREVPFSLTYADTAQNWFVGYTTGSVAMDAAAVGSDWGSGEELPVSVTDQDLNRNSLVQEYLVVNPFDDNQVFSMQLGAEGDMVAPFLSSFTPTRTIAIDLPGVPSPNADGVSRVPSGTTLSGDLAAEGGNTQGNILQQGRAGDGALYFEWDITALGPNAKVKVWSSGGGDFFNMGIGAGGTFLPEGNEGNVRIDTHPALRADAPAHSGTLQVSFADTVATSGAQDITLILRLYDTTSGINTLEETGLNTGVFDGTIEYVMLNQINTVYDAVTDMDMANRDTAALATGLTEDTVIILDGDYLDEDGIRIDYLDTDKQGQTTTVSAKTDAPTHSGSVSLDQDNYKQADTVKITLEDADLNLNNELRDVYTAITDLTTHNRDTISRGGDYATSADDGLLLEATFDDTRWISCGTAATEPKGFGTLISSIRETAPTSGVFVADFQIPREYCTPILNDDGTQITGASVASTTLGKDLEVTYYDYFDSAGERNEVGDVAGITSFTGSVSLDRSVYPVPFAPLDANDRAASDSTPAKFRYHESFKDSNAAADTASRYIDDLGDVMIHVQINDKDLDQSGSGTDRITNAAEVLTVEISRDNIKIPPASATETALTGKEIRETSPTSGIFELDLPITWQDGPWQG